MQTVQTVQTFQSAPHLPLEEQTITVELTLKEAIALSGYRFNQDRHVLARAMGKVKKSIDRACLMTDDRIDYHTLEM